MKNNIKRFNESYSDEKVTEIGKKYEEFRKYTVRTTIEDNINILYH